MKYIIKNTSNGECMNVLVSDNGKVLNSTETMHQHSSVLKNIYAQMKGHGSRKNIRVFDEVKGVKFKLRFVNNGVEKFGEKKYSPKQK